MWAFPTQLQDSPGSLGFSLQEWEQEQESAPSDGFLAASCKFLPRFPADMSKGVSGHCPSLQSVEELQKSQAVQAGANRVPTEQAHWPRKCRPLSKG
jgi:hypothetical protein